MWTDRRHLTLTPSENAYTQKAGPASSGPQQQPQAKVARRALGPLNLNNQQVTQEDMGKIKSGPTAAPPRPRRALGEITNRVSSGGSDGKGPSSTDSHGHVKKPLTTTTTAIKKPPGIPPSSSASSSSLLAPMPLHTRTHTHTQSPSNSTTTSGLGAGATFASVGVKGSVRDEDVEDVEFAMGRLGDEEDALVEEKRWRRLMAEAEADVAAMFVSSDDDLLFADPFPHDTHTSDKELMQAMAIRDRQELMSSMDLSAYDTDDHHSTHHPFAIHGSWDGNAHEDDDVWDADVAGIDLIGPDEEGDAALGV